MKLRRDQMYNLLLALLVAFACILSFISVRDDAPTYDEIGHLTAGYLYWTTGDLTWNSEHPPLGKYLCALPLLALQPDVPTGHPAYKRKALYEVSRQFVFNNRYSAETIITCGRIITMLWFALLLMLTAWMIRPVAGEIPALLGVAFLACEPTVIAHARYVTSDMPVTAAAVGALQCWSLYLKSCKRRWALFSGIAVGSALSIKFSALFVALAFVFIALLSTIPTRAFLSGLAFCLAGAYSVLNVVYLPEFPALLPGSSRLYTPSAPVQGQLLLDRALLLRPNSLSAGLAKLRDRKIEENGVYLLGSARSEPSVSYFPIAFAVKTSLGFLCLLGTALFFVRRPRSVPQAAVLRSCLISALTLFALALTSNVNIGIRHVLPVYPLLVIAACSAISERRTLLLAISAVVLVFVENVAIYPHYLAFFNAASGGPSRGDRVLVDSNLDWGQDLKRAGTYIRAHNYERVCLTYFGQSDPSYYGLPRRNYIPSSSESSAREELDCIGLISVTYLHDAFLPTGSYAWLRNRRPVDRIGYSIEVFDLRKPH